jgi:hypothetical protein
MVIQPFYVVTYLAPGVLGIAVHQSLKRADIHALDIASLRHGTSVKLLVDQHVSDPADEQQRHDDAHEQSHFECHQTDAVCATRAS